MGLIWQWKWPSIPYADSGIERLEDVFGWDIDWFSTKDIDKFNPAFSHDPSLQWKPGGATYDSKPVLLGYNNTWATAAGITGSQGIYSWASYAGYQAGASALNWRKYDDESGWALINLNNSWNILIRPELGGGSTPVRMQLLMWADAGADAGTYPWNDVSSVKATSTVTISQENWQWLSLKFECTGTNIRAAVELNGGTIIPTTTLAIANTPSSASHLRIMTPIECTDANNQSGELIGDVVMYRYYTDTSPVAYNYMRIVDTEDSNVGAWTAVGAATNVVAVNPTSSNISTEYSENTLAVPSDELTLSDSNNFDTELGMAAGTIIGVGSYFSMKADGTGEPLFAAVGHGGSFEAGPVTTSSLGDYSTIYKVATTCPSTAGAWTSAQVTASKIKIEVD